MILNLIVAMNRSLGQKKWWIARAKLIGLALSNTTIALPTDYTLAISVNKIRRTYVLHDVSSANPKPLVILLHGWTSNGREILSQTEFGTLADREGFVVAAPDGMNGGWNAGFVDLSGKKLDDVQFISDVIEDVARRVKIDPTRIYVVGHSNGAMLAHTVGANLVNKVSAIAAVAGTTGVIGSKGVVRMKAPTGAVNVLMIHSKRDPMVAYDSTSQAMLKGISEPKSAQQWANWLHCDQLKHETIPNVATVDVFKNQAVEVRLVSLNNGFHEWPGGVGHGRRETKSSFDATSYIWNWLRSKSKPSQ